MTPETIILEFGPTTLLKMIQKKTRIIFGNGSISSKKHDMEILDNSIQLKESLPQTHPRVARSSQHSDSHPCIRLSALWFGYYLEHAIHEQCGCKMVRSENRGFDNLYT